MHFDERTTSEGLLCLFHRLRFSTLIQKPSNIHLNRIGHDHGCKAAGDGIDAYDGGN